MGTRTRRWPTAAQAMATMATLVVTACSAPTQITTEGTGSSEERAAELEAAALLEVALEKSCEAAIDAYLPTYAEPQHQPQYRAAHLSACESEQAQTGLRSRAWHCIADLEEMERIRVQCHSVDPDDRSVRTGHVVPFAHRKPTHFRGGNTMIRWSGIR